MKGQEASLKGAYVVLCVYIHKMYYSPDLVTDAFCAVAGLEDTWAWAENGGLDLHTKEW